MQNVQIRALYEQGCTPEQIADAMPGLDVDAVRIMLRGTSAKYRKENDDELFDAADSKRMARLALDMVDDPDTPAPTRAKLIQFVINEQRGRNGGVKEAAKALSQVNVNLINIRLQQMDARYTAAKTQTVIDLPAEDQQLIEQAV